MSYRRCPDSPGPVGLCVELRSAGCGDWAELLHYYRSDIRVLCHKILAPFAISGTSLPSLCDQLSLALV